MDGAAAASPAPARITRSTARRLPAIQLKASSSTLPSVKIPKVSSSASSLVSNKAASTSSSTMPPPSAMPPPRTPVPRIKVPVPAPRGTKKLATENDVLSTPSGISRAGQSLQSARTTPLQSASSSRGNVASLIATPHQPPLRMPSDSNWARRTYAVEAKADNTRMMTTPSGNTQQRSLRQPTNMTRVSRINKSNLKTPHSFSGSTSQLRSKAPSKSGVENIVPESDENTEYIAEVHSEPANSVVPGPSALKKLKQPSLDEASSHSHDLSPLAPSQPSIDISVLQSELLSLRDQLDTERKIAAQIVSQTEGLHKELSTLREEVVSLRSEISIKDQLLETTSVENQILNSQVAELEESQKLILVAKEKELSEKEVLLAKIEEKYLENVVCLEASLQTLQNDSESKQSELEELKKNWNEAKEKTDKVENQLKSLKAKHVVEAEDFVTEKAYLLKRVDDVQKEAESWQSAMELKSGDLRKLQTELAEVCLENERLMAVEKENANVRMKNEDLTVRNQALATTEKKLRSAVKEKEEAIEALSRRSTMLCQEKETLLFKLNTPSVSAEKGALLEEDEVSESEKSGSL